MKTEAAILRQTGRTSMCLYVFSPSNQERFYQIQHEQLSDFAHTLSEHHITIAEVFEHEQSHMGAEELPSDNSEHLRRQFHINPGQFKVVLAADNGVRLSAESCVSCEEVIMRIENQPAESIHSF